MADIALVANLEAGLSVRTKFNQLITDHNLQDGLNADFQVAIDAAAAGVAEINAKVITVSTGAPDASKIVGTGANGKTDVTLLPDNFVNQNATYDDDAPLWSIGGPDGRAMFALRKNGFIKNSFLDRLSAKVAPFTPRTSVADGGEEGPLQSWGGGDMANYAVMDDGSLRGKWISDVAGAARKSSPPAIVYIDGDSRGDLNTNAGRTRVQGMVAWLQVLSGGRFDIRNEWNFGSGGQNSKQFSYRRTRIMDVATPATVIACCDTNDRTEGQTATWTITELQAYQDAVLKKGHRLIWIAGTPRGDSVNTSYTLGATDLDHAMTVHHWFLAQAQVPGVYVVDVMPLLMDRSLTNGRAYDWVLRDGIHWGAYVAYLIARACQPVLEMLIPVRNVLPASNGDLATSTNPGGSLIDNPMLLGTGGSGGTGSVATGLTCVPAAGLTATNEKIIVPNGTPTGVEYQRCVVTGGPTGTAGTDVALNVDPRLVSVVFEASIDVSSDPNSEISEVGGDILQAVCEVRVQPGALGMRSVSLYIEMVSGGSTYTWAGMEPDVTRSQPNLDCHPDEWSGVLITLPTDPLPARASITSLKVYLAIVGANFSVTAQTLNATVDFRALSPFKLL